MMGEARASYFFARNITRRAQEAAVSVVTRHDHGQGVTGFVSRALDGVNPPSRCPLTFVRTP